MAADDLVARARELGAPMLAPESGIARRSALLLALADRVEELEGLLRECEWIEQGWSQQFGPRCPLCDRHRGFPSSGHAPGCRLARALGNEGKSDA